MLIPFGGIGEFIYPGDKVFLKPSANRAALPYTGENTDPGFIEAVAALCFEAGAAQVIIGEAPIEGLKALEASGLIEVAQRTGAVLLDLNEKSPVKRHLPQALFMEEVEFYNQPLLADVFINLPKLKADKNGVLDCGFTNLASLLSHEQKNILAQDFSRGLVDVLSLLKPDLNLVDGILAYKNNKPVEAKIILAGIDTVAVDTVAGALMGLDLKEMPYLALASQYALGTWESGDISIFGADLRPIMQKFKEEE